MSQEIATDPHLFTPMGVFIYSKQSSYIFPRLFSQPPYTNVFRLAYLFPTAEVPATMSKRVTSNYCSRIGQ